MSSFLGSVLASINGEQPVSTSQATIAQRPLTTASRLGPNANPQPRIKNSASATAPTNSSSPTPQTSISKFSTSTTNTFNTGRPITNVRPGQSTTAGFSTKSNPSIPITTNSTIVAGKPPPRGSYREILARAQAARQQQTQIGAIKHKAIQKVSKRERRAHETEAAANSVGVKGKNGVSGKHGRVVSNAESGLGKVRQPVRPKRMRVDLGYTGTMRPSAPTRLAKTTQSSGLDRQRETLSEDEDLPDEDDYDESESDMEAAGYEIEEEEMASLRKAKEEDEKALREEQAHRSQKDARRRAMEQLKKSRQK